MWAAEICMLYTIIVDQAHCMLVDVCQISYIETSSESGMYTEFFIAYI